MGKEILFKEESYKIIGCCFEVYNDKSNGFLEAVYQECLRLEFNRQHVLYVEKPRLALEYKGTILEQTYEPDYLCYDNIIVELKAVRKLADEHRAQVFNYMKSTGKRLGLLVNFGAYPDLNTKELLNNELFV